MTDPAPTAKEAAPTGRGVRAVLTLVVVAAALGGALGALWLAGGPDRAATMRPGESRTTPTAAPSRTARPRATPSPTRTAGPTAKRSATATPTVGRTSRPTATPTETTGSWRAADGVVEPPEPYFRYTRPFDAALDNRTSRYYPYGTTANGQYLLHHGVDIGNGFGAQIRAVGDGRVVYAGSDAERAWGPQTDFYGDLVVIRHAEGIEGRVLYSLYGHVSRALVRAGQSVRAGQPVAEVGSGGVALGPHLHLEFRTASEDYGATVNPDLLLEMLPGHGTIVGRALDAADGPLDEAVVSLYALADGGPGDWLAQTVTYPSDHVNAAPGWRENFVLADTPAGAYFVAVDADGVRSGVPVTVTSGAAVFVTLPPRLPD